MRDEAQLRLPNNLIFDLDGTLLDSLPGIAFSVHQACRMVGLPEPEIDLRHLLGPPIREILAKAVKIRDQADLDALEAAFRASYDGEGWQRTVCFPHAATVLELMRSQGHRLFVVSNKPRNISLRILRAEGLLGLFEEIVTADSRKPVFSDKKEMLRTLIQQYALNGCECLFVGDTIEDAEAAAAAETGFVYMKHGYGDLPDTSPVPVILRLQSFAGFFPLLTQESARD